MMMAVAVGACAPDVDEVGSGETLQSSIFDTYFNACTSIALPVNAASKTAVNGLQISLADAPVACAQSFTSSSSGAGYRSNPPSDCDHYVVELTGLSRRPAPNETLRADGGLKSPKLLATLGSSKCNDLIVEVRVYTHMQAPQKGAGTWHSYATRVMKGHWNGLGCDLVPSSSTGLNEIPPFPADSTRDKIRIATRATGYLSTTAYDVAGGARLGTCAPTKQGEGAFCNADDECTSDYCAAGVCCGDSAAARKICDHNEGLASASLP